MEVYSVCTRELSEGLIVVTFNDGSSLEVKKINNAAMLGLPKICFQEGLDLLACGELNEEGTGEVYNWPYGVTITFENGERYAGNAKWSKVTIPVWDSKDYDGFVDGSACHIVIKNNLPRFVYQKE